MDTLMKSSCKGKVFSAEEVTENGCAEQGDKVIALVDRRDMTSYKTQTCTCDTLGWKRQKIVRREVVLMCQ